MPFLLLNDLWLVSLENCEERLDGSFYLQFHFGDVPLAQEHIVRLGLDVMDRNVIFNQNSQLSSRELLKPLVSTK